jgi:serine/threonine protein kinase
MHSSRAETTPGFDVWSLGVTLHELATGVTPWTEEQRRTRIVLVRYLVHRYATEPIELDNELLKPTLKDMIATTLQFEVSARPTLGELRGHPFFSEDYSISAEPPSTNRVLSKLEKLRDGISVTATPHATCTVDINNALPITASQDTQ